MIPSIFRPAPLFILGAFAIPLVACVYDDDPPRHLHDYEDTPSSTGPAAPVPSGTGVGTVGSSPSPLLVEVDTDQTMSADPGEGVGVFVEYAKGGHWHVWWTCDTNKTQQSCTYSVNASTASGSITNLDAGDLVKQGNTVTPVSANRIEARTTTTTQTHSLYFDTDAGAVLTVDASLDGLQDGSFLFFVQDGKVNGGYAGRLTNPLQLQGKTP